MNDINEFDVFQAKSVDERDSVISKINASGFLPESIFIRESKNYYIVACSDKVKGKEFLKGWVRNAEINKQH